MAPHAQNRTHRRVHPVSLTVDIERIVHRGKSRVRSRVAPDFTVVKQLWGFSKVRYPGLAKNGCRGFVVLALANMDLARGRLVGRVRPQID